jgi:hypothetical protein
LNVGWCHRGGRRCFICCCCQHSSFEITELHGGNLKAAKRSSEMVQVQNIDFDSQLPGFKTVTEQMECRVSDTSGYGHAAR